MSVNCVCVKEREWQLGGRAAGSQSEKISSLGYEGADIDSWVNESRPFSSVRCEHREIVCSGVLYQSEHYFLFFFYFYKECGLIGHLTFLPSLPPPLSFSFSSPSVILTPSLSLSLPVFSSGERRFHKERRVYPGEDGSDVQGQGPLENSVWPWE